MESLPLHIRQYTISSDLFEKGYAAGRGPCTCTSVCCQNGVYVDRQERDRILAHRELIKKYMDETQTTDERQWFEQHEEEDDDFASGRCVGTEVVNEKCAFLDKLGRCSIQTAAVGEGMHKWALKPIFCILFPLEIMNHVIGFDDLLQEDQPCCSVSNEFDVPVFVACREELIHVLGEDGYRKLDAFCRTRTLEAELQEKDAA